jgi:hypothetical protein
VIDGDRTAFWMPMFCLLMLIYTCVLALRSRLPADAHR